MARLSTPLEPSGSRAPATAIRSFGRRLNRTVPAAAVPGAALGGLCSQLACNSPWLVIWVIWAGWIRWLLGRVGLESCVPLRSSGPCVLPRILVWGSRSSTAW